MASFMGIRFAETFGVTIGDQIVNVDFPVRPGKPNDIGDVQLVQIMLNNVLGSRFTKQVPLRDEAGIVVRDEVEVNGIFGPRTQRMLRAYQRQVKGLTKGFEFATAKSAIQADGIVDKANQTGVSTVSKTIYTIVFLNMAWVAEKKRAFEASDAEGADTLRNQLTPLEVD